jgi:hypothetical protein
MLSHPAWKAIFVCLAFSSLQSIAVAADTAPKGIDAIAAYAGSWQVEIEHLDTPRSKAGHEKNALRNACWRDGEYFACNQYVDGESKVLIVFTYNAKDNIYTSYQIPLGGGESGSGKLQIEGNVWTFPWEITDAGRTTYFHVINVFTAPDRIEFRQEFSSDHVHWTVTAKGSEKKIANP